MPAPPLSLAGIVGSLHIPTLRDLIYASKAFVAAGVALGIGFASNLDNPYWSALTVYMIVNPPGAGAIRTKCAFRLLGTVIGGLLVLGDTSLFGDQLGILLTSTIAIIVGSIYLSQIDKTPASYLWLAISITAAVVALNNLLHPDRLYAVTAARLGEISLGIMTTAAVDCFWPEPITPKFLETMDGWRGKARDFALAALRPGASDDGARRGELLELIKGVQTIDGRAVQLPFDVVPRPPRTRALDLVRRQVVATVGDLIAVELRARHLQDETVSASPVAGMVDEVSSWLRDEAHVAEDDMDRHVDRGHRLARALEAASAGLDDTMERSALVEAGLLARLAAFADDWCDLLLALGAVRRGERLPPELDALAAHAKPVRSVDHLATVLNIVPLVLAMTVTSVIWYLTAWDSGPTALLFSWGASIFLLGQGQILQSMGGLLFCLLAAMGLVFLYQFVVLPRVTDFPILLLVLGCGLVPLGLLMAMSMAGMLIAGMAWSFLALQSVYHADFAQSLQTLFALLVGMLIALISLRVCSYDRARFTMRRLAAAVRRDVVDVACTPSVPDRDRFRFLGFYRLSLYFPAAEQAAAGQPPPREGLIGDLSIGFNLLSLRREAAVSGGARELIGSLRSAAATAFKAKLAGRDDDGELDAIVDRALDDAALRRDPAHRTLLDALTGIHLARGAASAPDAHGAAS